MWLLPDGIVNDGEKSLSSPCARFDTMVAFVVWRLSFHKKEDMTLATRLGPKKSPT
jgi:hypothetical protein